MSSNEKTATITVTQAVFGAVQGVHEVTQAVQNLVRNGRTSFTADRDTLTPGDDPAPGHDKHFAMNYTIGSTQFAFACKEGEKVSLRTREPQERVTVVGAAYGTINKEDPTEGARDVTAVVQDLLDASSGDVIKFKPTNDLFGDPFKGPRKNFGMVYISKKSPGQRRFLASNEGQEVTVDV